MSVQGAGSDVIGAPPARSISEPTLGGLLSIAQLGRLWATSGNLLLSEEVKSVPAHEVRRVAFQPLVRVVLIPSRKEYAAANLLATLWWEDSDYTSFKTAAVVELKKVMLAKNIRSSKEAIKILYQPDFHCQEEISDDVTFEGEDVSADAPITSATTISAHLKFCHGNEEERAKMGLIEARTDVEITDLRRHHREEVETKIIHVHPLAYMCE